MNKHQKINIYQNNGEDLEELLERLLDWGESTRSCDSLQASELMAEAEKSGDPLKQELAGRYAASLGW